MQIAISKYLTETSNVSIPGVIIYNKLSDVPKSNTFFCGSRSDCEYLTSCMYGITKFFNLSVSKWLAFVKNSYINFDCYFKLACQLSEKDLNKFCRTNSNKKEITGRIIENIYDISSIKASMPEDTLLLLASKKNIFNEIRFWIINEKIIDYAILNKSMNSISDNLIEEYKKFVEKNVIDSYQPDDMFTVDIGMINNEIKIVDFNCFSLSEFYNANIEKISKSILEYF